MNFSDTQGTTQTLTVNLTGEILPLPLPDSSNASFSTGSDLDVLNIDFGSVITGSSVPASSLQLANYEGSAAHLEDLDLVSTSGSGDTGILTTNIVPFVDLASGSSLSFDSMIDTSTVGTYAASYDLNFTDDLGTTQILTLNLSGEVLPLPPPPDPSNASFATGSDLDVLHIDFGSVAMGTSVPASSLQLANYQGAATLIDSLDLVSTVGSGDTGILTTNIVPFVDLAGGSSLSFDSMIDTSTAGTYAASYDLNFTDDQGTNQTLTLNLSGEVAPLSSSNASFASDSDLDSLTIDFGTVGVGRLSNRVYFDIFNLDSVPLTALLESVQVIESGDVDEFWTNIHTPDDIAGGESQTFYASIYSQEPGEVTATYEIQFTDELGTDQTLTLNLMGEAVQLPGDGPDLIYDPSTGEVLLDASDIGGGLQSYNIQSAGGGILNGNFTSILTSSPVTNLPTEIGEFKFGQTATAPGGTSIGFVFPLGMSLAELSEFVTGGSASAALVAPSYEWDLVILNSNGSPPGAPIPEPSTYALALIGLLALGGFQRWRCR